MFHNILLLRQSSVGFCCALWREECVPWSHFVIVFCLPWHCWHVTQRFPVKSKWQFKYTRFKYWTGGLACAESVLCHWDPSDLVFCTVHFLLLKAETLRLVTVWPFPRCSSRMQAFYLWLSKSSVVKLLNFNFGFYRNCEISQVGLFSWTIKIIWSWVSCLVICNGNVLTKCPGTSQPVTRQHR